MDESNSIKVSEVQFGPYILDPDSYTPYRTITVKIKTCLEQKQDLSVKPDGDKEYCIKIGHAVADALYECCKKEMEKRNVQ